MQRLLEWVAKLLRTFFPPKIEEVEFIPIEIPMETNQEKLIKEATKARGTDVSPKNLAPQELSCAEGVSELLRRVYPDFKIQISTAELFKQLKLDKRFKATLTPSAGCVIISPRTSDTYGHTGIFLTNDKIASNDSRKGVWEQNYTWDSWIREFRDKRGLRIYLFELI